MYTGPTNTRTCIQRPPLFFIYFLPFVLCEKLVVKNIAWHHLSLLLAKYLLANLTVCLISLQVLLALPRICTIERVQKIHNLKSMKDFLIDKKCTFGLD